MTGRVKKKVNYLLLQEKKKLEMEMVEYKLRKVLRGVELNHYSDTPLCALPLTDPGVTTARTTKPPRITIEIPKTLTNRDSDE